jgi:short-subunit dehydrogenase
LKTLNQRVAAITGGGAGIGRAIALRLAREGCHLALADINRESLEETHDLLKAYPVNVSLHTVDVRDFEQVSRFAEDCVAHHGQVNVIINNAGITLQKQFTNHSLDDWHRVIDINLYGVIHGCKAFLPILQQADEAHIVNMSSMAGFMGLPVQASYCATKAAVRALSETLWTELQPQGIGVTSVHPGAIKTDIMQRTLAESDDIASATRAMEMAMRFAMPVDKAADKIVQAVLKNKQRVLVGADSRVFDLLKRLLPTLSQRLMAFLVNRMRPA